MKERHLTGRQGKRKRQMSNVVLFVPLNTFSCFEKGCRDSSPCWNPRSVSQAQPKLRAAELSYLCHRSDRERHSTASFPSDSPFSGGELGTLPSVPSSIAQGVAQLSGRPLERMYGAGTMLLEMKSTVKTKIYSSNLLYLGKGYANLKPHLC